MLRDDFACLFAICTLVLATARISASSKPSDAELAAITARGVLLAEYDTVAWQATDAVKATHPAKGRVGRYIARKTEAGWLVDFGRFNQAQDKFLVAYEAVEMGSPAHFEVKGFDPAREDMGWNLAAARGIETAARDFGATSRPYNIAILPDESEGMYVYLYPAQINAGVYPFGADVRYRVSLDGTKIIEKHQMHKTVIESVPARTHLNVAVGYHSHVLSDLPEDTDVMVVLTRKPQVPEIVITRTYMFNIDVDGKITVSDRPR
ncbi:MAG: hypothetical protein ACLQVL_15355 [Terriglobia bacterium]